MNALRALKGQLVLYWLGRTEQERKFLAIGAGVALLALVYSLFISPAMEGRAKLRRDLPELRQQEARMKAMALEAGELARDPAPQLAPMTRESLLASMSARSLKAESITMNGDFAKVQVNGVAFAGLFSWLEAQRRENRIGVFDAAVTAATPQGQVDAVLTLRQIRPDAAAQ